MHYSQFRMIGTITALVVFALGLWIVYSNDRNQPLLPALSLLKR